MLFTRRPPIRSLSIVTTDEHHVRTKWIGIMSALAGNLVMLIPWSLAAQSVCTPLIPEAIEAVSIGGLPTDEVRWRAAERIWTEASQTTKVDIANKLRGGGLYPAADIIQGRTHDLLREAIIRRRLDLSNDLLDLWIAPYSVVAQQDSLLVPYAKRGESLSVITYDRKHPVWLGSDGVETVLYSAIYLAGATDILNTIAQVPREARTQQMNEFALRTASISKDHYLRWAVGQPGIWQVRGWGCEAGGLDLVEFTKQRLEGSLGNGYRDYCRAPTDADMLIAIGIVNLLAAASHDSEFISLSDEDRTTLIDVARLLVRFMSSHFVVGTIMDETGQSKSTVDFDPGVWRLHSEMAYAGDQEAKYPGREPQPQPGVGWDFSHGARIAWMLLTFADNSDIAGRDRDWEWMADSFARQIAYRVLDDDADVPRFRNYLDGSNGWYRVNFAGREGTGTPPFGLSRAYLTMPWARLTARDPRLMTAAVGMWRMLTGATMKHCENFKKIYVEESYWQDRKPSVSSFVGRNSLELLTFLAATPVR